MRGALVAPRADHGGGLGVDQILQPGLEQTPEDVIVSQIRVGKDFPDQRGHGRLVRGGWIAPGLMEAVMTGRITAMGLKEVLVGAARAGD